MSKSTVQTEIKEFEYFEAFQKFYEKNHTTQHENMGSFRIPYRKQRVIHSGNRTIVILNDGSKGIAKCSPEDDFNKLKGVKIAYLRAKIKSLMKELRELCRS